ncbi:MAG: diaminopimelate epimerase [Balneola sp.]|nr:diaminopimelate epimerase [Balneola sp.]MBO6651586.1 diaminopimelate epimerase [Balneola sp.]MBO6710939.1 diaminopimelate epimerase [Balneola sp.]MBO6799626.1 diaminopimelate epimerase [Balneola sp.]MBO6870359.1 diaminopimelate epimerase [Balneola sp.]
MTGIKFYKMEGAGNDFVVIDNRELQFSIEEIIAFTPVICSRRFGIGADGLIALENPQIDGADYTMIYRNADGSDAGMCGNGSRCLALFAATHGFDSSQSFNVHGSIYKAEVDLKNNSVSVRFPDVSLPVNIKINEHELIQVYTGTEHVANFVASDQLDKESELVSTGSALRNHNSLNPPGSNVNFVCKTDQSAIRLQTYERGVEGLTLACGTGAIASAIATHFSSQSNLINNNYLVRVAGGDLNVSFKYDADKSVYTNIELSGPANFVFEGKINV